MQLRKGSKVGLIYQLNNIDVKNTKLIQLLDQFLINPHVLSSRKREQSSPQPKKPNAKVGVNYFNALEGIWLDQMIQKEQNLLLFDDGKGKKSRIDQPGKVINSFDGVTDFLSRDGKFPPSKNFNQGSEPPINQVLAHINTLNESEPCMKEPPSSLKPVFEKFKLENAD